jgi:hypothetical protein
MASLFINLRERGLVPIRGRRSRAPGVGHRVVEHDVDQEVVAEENEENGQSGIPVARERDNFEIEVLLAK